LPDPCTEAIKSFLSLSNAREISQSPSTPSDLIQGKLGYIYTLLSLRNRITIPVELPPMEALVGMTRHALDVGTEGSARLFSGFLDREGVNSQFMRSCPAPYLWNWGLERFVGARGIAGGICMLASVLREMQISPAAMVEVKEEVLPIKDAEEEILSQAAVKEALKRSLSYMSRHARLFNGNYLVRADDHLLTCTQLYPATEQVGFSHGAGGIGIMLCHVAGILGEDGKQYIDYAKDCGQVVWERGIVKAGTGLARGVAGNAYLFLALWKATGEIEYWKRAVAFMDVVGDWREFTKGETELVEEDGFFEGQAGVACLYADIAYPEKFVGFPLFSDI
jgi:hypothetical protein